MRRALLILFVALPLLAQAPAPDRSAGRNADRNVDRNPGRNSQRRSRAAAKPEAASEDPNAISAEGLLRQVQQDARQLAPADQAYILGRMITVAERVEPGLVRPLAEEIFQLAPQLPEASRNRMESPAVLAMATSDPDFALQLLERMDPPAAGVALPPISSPPGTADGFAYNMRGNEAGAIFNSYWREKKGAGLDRLRTAASRLGEKGLYPYSAFAGILRELNGKDSPAAEALFGEVLQNYRASSGSYAQNADFVRLLSMTRGAMPPALYREGVTMAVANVERQQSDDDTAATTTITSGVSSVSLHGTADRLMLQLLPLVRQLDPEWATQLSEKHADAGRAAGLLQAPFRGGGSTNMNMSVTSGSSPSSPSPSPPGAASGAQAFPGIRGAFPSGMLSGMAERNPEAALRMSQNITDPAARAAANAQIAAGLAQSNPQRAAALLDQASQVLGELQDPVGQLTVLASLAQGAYSAGHRDEAAGYMERGFTLADEVVRKDFDEHPDQPVYSLKGVSQLADLTRTAVKIDAAGAISRVNGVRYPLLRSYLMLTAAEGLQQGRRFGPGFASARSSDSGGGTRPPASRN